MKNKFKNNQIRIKKLILAVGLPVLLIIFSIIFIFSNISFAAQAADNIARPILGEKNTIHLEAVYFSLQDKINSLKYLVSGQQAPVFYSGKILKKEKFINLGQMNLNQLNISNNLTSLNGEGQWIPIIQNLYPKQVIIARTFIRPDISRPYAVVSLVKMDMKKLAIGAQAGTYYPGGPHKIYGLGIVPKNIQNSNNLLAVFNGGFQEKDGHYGMIVGNTTYVPLRNNLATLLLYKDGSIKLINYTGQKLDPNVLAVRQNGPFLIKNGKITSFVEQGPDTWGRTTTNSMYTWRSGVGITKNGNLIYAVGNSLIPKTLAQALLSAGAQNALQLDINPFWVRFILYASKGNGQYNYFPLLSSMQNGGYQYLHGYNKDFFYVYKK